MPTHTTYYQRANGDGPDIEIEVDFELIGGSEPSGMSGPPEHYDPGEAPEFVLVGAAIRATGEEVDLTDEEAAAVEADVMDRLDDFDGRDDYPEDY